MNLPYNKALLDETSALDALRSHPSMLLSLLDQASKARDANFGRKVSMCAIVNAKSGGCPEDCAFCPQSHVAKSDIARYSLMTTEQILAGAREAKEGGAGAYSIVLSGTALRARKEVDLVKHCISEIAALGLLPCASIGLVDPQIMRELAQAGLKRIHHNLETARSYFPQICTTHPYDQDIETIQLAKQLGLSVCSGGIMGMGESLEQRVELAKTLSDLRVNSVAMNFYVPIAGTRLSDRLQGKSDLTPIDCLKAVAVYRLMLPWADITVCGGREHNLRELQPLLLSAGANRLMSGNYLTTSGRDFKRDVQMIQDMGFELTMDRQYE
jgi:biotin synthase